CTIDCEDAARGMVFDDGEGAGTRVVGVTIANGAAPGGAFPGNTGGGVYMVGASPTFEDCDFVGNFAGFGGAVFCDNSSPRFVRCDFGRPKGGNQAGTSGAGAYFFAGSAPELEECRFIENAAQFGGGVLNDAASPLFNVCEFARNSATEFGGGMESINGSAPTLIECLFQGNEAFFGGAMCTAESRATVVRCLFGDPLTQDPGNNASGRGGAVYNFELAAAPPGHVDYLECLFRGNEAPFGGAANNEASDTVYEGCVFGDEKDPALGNIAEYGAAMFSFRISRPVVRDCLFMDGQADRGGAIFNFGGVTTLIESCTFVRNAAGFGGAMFNLGANVEVRDCAFGDPTSDLLANTASASGGAIANEGSAPLIVGCTIARNSAGNLGGGVFSSESAAR
ncbi:MAG: right-handed parallel beta-helix repeat-containing protein, partial [Planctomycetota bacterium]|nr:right-handed parallel beta-helix repeat-containing protein [Planctomycetota bacterium]